MRRLRSDFAIPLILCAALTYGAAAAEVDLMRVPDQGIQPQVAVDSSGTVHLLYFRGKPGEGDVFYARKTAREKGFSAPLPVNSTPGAVIAIGSIRGAQLAVGRDGRAHVAWMGSKASEPKSPDGESGMLYTRLKEDGSGFEPERNVIASHYGLDGGGTVAADPEGNVYVVWHGMGDEKGEGNRRVWVAASHDDGQTFAPETAADSQELGACGCCGIKAFAGQNGELLILYRSARENVNRDMQLLASADKGQTFKTHLLTRWAVAQCPMSSASIVQKGKNFVIAWETTGQVNLSTVTLAKGEKPAKAVATPVQASGSANGRKHPSLAVNSKGETLLVWDEGTGWQRGGSLSWQIFDAKGKPTTRKGRQDGIPVWSFPAAYAKPDGSFAILY